MVGFVKFVMALVFIDATSIFGSQLDAHVDLDKPVIDAPLEPENRTFSRRMLDQLQSTQGTIIRTNMTTKICYDCQIKFQELGLNFTSDGELFNVTYNDCGGQEPWIMCRHKDAVISQVHDFTL